jgi:hypothetical protein
LKEILFFSLKKLISNIIQPEIKSNPPIGVIGPRNLKSIDVTFFVVNRNIEKEKRTTPILIK